MLLLMVSTLLCRRKFFLAPSIPFVRACLLRYVLFYSIALMLVIVDTTFFETKFGAHTYDKQHKYHEKDPNNPKIHTIIYLQVAVISQALIFVTRSHGFFFMERPSYALIGAFFLAQLVSSVIAAWADWGFSNIQGVDSTWIGIVWVWV